MGLGMVEVKDLTTEDTEGKKGRPELMNRFDDTGCFCIETLCSLCLCGEKSWPENAELLASIAFLIREKSA